MNLVAALADTGYADPAGVPFIYKLTAIDAHGNESAVATLIPTGTLDASGTPALHAFLELAGANPSRAASALRFGLPAAGRVHLAVHDAAGRQVRTLAEGEFPAGQHSAEWDGNEDAGHPVAAGLYFARIDTPGFTATRRIARLR